MCFDSVILRCSFLIYYVFTLLMLSGVHNSPLDGSDLQVETTKEQDSRKD